MFSGKTTTERHERMLALGLSVLAHVIFVALLLRSRPPVEQLPSVIDVTLEADRPVSRPPQQISSPSERATERAPESARRLSEVNSIVEREQVRRGDPVNAPKSEPVRPQQKPDASKAKNSPARREEPTAVKKPAQTKESARPDAATNKESRIPKNPAGSEKIRERPRGALRELMLDEATLSSRFGSTRPSPARDVRPSRPQASDLSHYRAFSRPAGSGASFFGMGGVTDYLPNLPDGDITLLNEKASTYAGFVRRVAVQVFTQLRSQGWERLSLSDIRAMNDFTTVEAVLNAKGELLRTTVVDSSGSGPFDAVLTQAVKRGARDPNPPPGARANDGLIHFIFKARSWADVGSDPRSGAPSERRWLLLATGLE